MKYIYWTVAGILLLGAGFLGLQTIASERVEVVELITQDQSGEDQITRLWVVDHDGQSYLRAGHAESGWYIRLNSTETIELIRDHATRRYKTQPTIELRDTINNLMQEKYTWSETLIGSMFDRSDSIPIRLIGSP